MRLEDAFHAAMIGAIPPGGPRNVPRASGSCHDAGESTEAARSACCERRPRSCTLLESPAAQKAAVPWLRSRLGPGLNSPNPWPGSPLARLIPCEEPEHRLRKNPTSRPPSLVPGEERQREGLQPSKNGVIPFRVAKHQQSPPRRSGTRDAPPTAHTIEEGPGSERQWTHSRETRAPDGAPACGTMSHEKRAEA